MTSLKQNLRAPMLRFVAGQTEELLVVGEPVQYELPPRDNETYPAVRHLANVVKRNTLDNNSERICHVWDMSDFVYRSLTCDPRRTWVRVTRHGRGKKSTRFEVAAIGDANDIERHCANKKIAHDLLRVANDTCARRNKRAKSKLRAI